MSGLLSCKVMAIATLERLFNNIEVFRGVVKIRKGEAIRLINESGDIEQVKAIMQHFLTKVTTTVTKVTTTIVTKVTITVFFIKSAKLIDSTIK
jgi:hypothetical protein